MVPEERGDHPADDEGRRHGLRVHVVHDQSARPGRGHLGLDVAARGPGLAPAVAAACAAADLRSQRQDRLLAGHFGNLDGVVVGKRLKEAFDHGAVDAAAREAHDVRNRLLEVPDEALVGLREVREGHLQDGNAGLPCGHELADAPRPQEQLLCAEHHEDLGGDPDGVEERVHVLQVVAVHEDGLAAHAMVLGEEDLQQARPAAGPHFVVADEAADRLLDRVPEGLA
mmetsp:Transcript_20161/g.60246  ORF Transcript_20161/g.60246 Transcript_20161/m.60246 type:complete len:227 (+) Transcript_20161:371-1051(+)